MSLFNLGAICDSLNLVSVACMSVGRDFACHGQLKRLSTPQQLLTAHSSWGRGLVRLSPSMLECLRSQILCRFLSFCESVSPTAMTCSEVRISQLASYPPPLTLCMFPDLGGVPDLWFMATGHNLS